MNLTCQESGALCCKRHSQELKLSTQNVTTPLSGMRVLQFLLLPALMNLSALLLCIQQLKLLLCLSVQFPTLRHSSSTGPLHF